MLHGGLYYIIVALIFFKFYHMKIKFLVPSFHMGKSYDKGGIYEVQLEEIKALDKKDYELAREDEEVTKPKAKGAPKQAENK